MGENKKKGKKDPKKMMPSFKFNPFYFFGVVFLLLIAIELFSGASEPVETNWNKVKRTMLKNDDIAKFVVINKDKVDIYLKEDSYDKYKNEFVGYTAPSEAGPHYYFHISSADKFEENLAAAQKDVPELDQVEFSLETQVSPWSTIMPFFFPILMVILIVYYFRRMNKGAGGGSGGGSGIFNVGKSQAKVYDKEKEEPVKFEDVAGLAEAKVEIEEIVQFLKNPEAYTSLGAKIPKGALLVGPPGNGKTLLAKAVAGEADVPFFSMSGSDFVEMFVGVGASRVRDLFKQAKVKSPSIVFIDEIDAIGRARGKNAGFSGNDERENTLNQLLTEMDGFGTNSGVIVLAATNRADILDKALMRAGRFDRQIQVGLPDLNERAEIFAVHMKPLKLNKDDINPEFLAKQTPGFSGADIANVCNEAALHAARYEKKLVEKEDFVAAVDRIIGGLEKKNSIITPHERKSIAFHEAGHAVTGWLLEFAHPLVKVTIVPRGNALGAAWYLPEEHKITTRQALIDEVCALLGGRAAEQLVFGTISTGAQNDLERVFKMVHAMVTVYGMSEKIGKVSYYDSTGQSDYAYSKPYSDVTSEIIDSEVKLIVDEAFDRTYKLLEDNREKFNKVAMLLLEKEVIYTEDVESIFGKRPWDTRLEQIESAKLLEEKVESVD